MKKTGNRSDSEIARNRADGFLEADGLYFRDLDKDGELDAYEDWRNDIETRVQDLISQMDLEEKAGTLIFSGVFGSNGSTVSDLGGNVEDGGSVSATGIPYVDDPETCLYSDETMVEVSGTNVQPMGISDPGGESDNVYRGIYRKIQRISWMYSTRSSLSRKTHASAFRAYFRGTACITPGEA